MNKFQDIFAVYAQKYTLAVRILKSKPREGKWNYTKFKVIPLHAMVVAYGAEEVQVHTFLTKHLMEVSGHFHVVEVSPPPPPPPPPPHPPTPAKALLVP